MATDVLTISSFDEALDLFLRLTESEEEFEQRIEIAPGWVTPHVYIPKPEVDSSISPPFMEAFLHLQKELFQLAALAKSGVSHVNQLNEIDRHDLEISVKVTSGSSNLVSDLAKPIERCFKIMLGKMTGRQATIVILGISMLIAGTIGWSSWLEQQKTIKIEELKSKEHIEALSALKFANENQLEIFKMLMQTLEKQGKVGTQSQDLIDSSFGALLKAASKTEKTEINGQRLTASEASSLRTSSRSYAMNRIIREKMRVVDMNTAAEVDAMILMRPVSKEQFKMKLSETLFMSDDRTKLFEALENRTEIEVELSLREVEGEVKTVTFLRVAPR
ncbi:hypothetical protein [Bosea sp. (in: a-proteobacteria)]|jgi:hypothetical protein|uniref:hypothetical protein n=1 Tax=Bosea sp. (in: a-proteobacteria) TaxID=1871050 RepID=UPI002DDD3CD0|nr:hypothetical protein [Bosea sp. (in: a-proteobacteria)]HEV2511221.1 hypothetical protein [Bosea sp. (in: a-proteobacteria)]